MKKIVLILLLLPMVLVGRNSLVLPAVEKHILKNGMTIYHLQDDLPRTTIAAAVNFGSLYETGDKAGLSSLLAMGLSMGGTKSWPGRKLNEYIESMGGKLKISASYETLVISITVLNRFADEAIDVLSEILQVPLLDNRSIALSRSLLVQNVKRNHESPFGLAFDKLKEELYPGEGYGVVKTEKSVASLTVDDVRSAWKDYGVGKNITIAVASSRKGGYFFRKLRGTLSSLARGRMMNYHVSFTKAKGHMRKIKGTLYFITRELPQATIVMGTVVPGRTVSRELPLEVLNYILGGGSFNSRFMKEIRVKRGLAYGTGTIVRMRKNTGIFMAYAQTKTSSAPEVISLMKKEIETIQKKSISTREVNWAKKYLANSYIFQFDETTKVLSAYLDLHYNDLPVSYLKEYHRRLAKVKSKTVLREARHLFRHGMITVVVGSGKLAENLEKQGIAVKRIQ